MKIPNETTWIIGMVFGLVICNMAGIDREWTILIIILYGIYTFMIILAYHRGR